MYADFQSFIKSNLIQVCLPPAASKYVGDRATVIGWGRTAHGQRETPDRLQEVEVEVISQKKCQEWFESNNRRETIFKDAFICAGFAEGGPGLVSGRLRGPTCPQQGITVDRTWIITRHVCCFHCLISPTFRTGRGL